MPILDSDYKDKIEISECSMEHIDRSLYNWVNDTLNIHTTTNEGWKKVPVIFVAGERVHQVKKDSRLRDTAGALILPLITVERTSVTKDPARKGPAWAHISEIDDYKSGSIVIARRIQQDKTKNFANAKSQERHGKLNFKLSPENKRVVYETISIPMPVYVDVTYQISIWTEYQQQMNEVTQPFMTKTGAVNYFTLSHQEHKFEGFIQNDLSLENNVSDMGEDERKFQSKVDIKVLGHLLGEGPNREKPFISKRENAVEVKFPRESIWFPEEID